MFKCPSAPLWSIYLLAKTLSHLKWRTVFVMDLATGALRVMLRLFVLYAMITVHWRRTQVT